jgi:hypothetical protein
MRASLFAMKNILLNRKQIASPEPLTERRKQPSLRWEGLNKCDVWPQLLRPLSEHRSHPFADIHAVNRIKVIGRKYLVNVA